VVGGRERDDPIPRVDRVVDAARPGETTCRHAPRGCVGGPFSEPVPVDLLRERGFCQRVPEGGVAHGADQLLIGEQVPKRARCICVVKPRQRSRTDQPRIRAREEERLVLELRLERVVPRAQRFFIALELEERIREPIRRVHEVGVELERLLKHRYGFCPAPQLRHRARGLVHYLRIARRLRRDHHQRIERVFGVPK
jgi:hypothetical protein